METKNIIDMLVAELHKNGMWFTTKADPTYNEAPSYYKLNQYGDLEESAEKKIANEIESLVGDGAVDITDAVDLWIEEALSDFKIAYTEQLVTKFKDKPVVNGIEAYTSQVMKENKKTTNLDESGDYVSKYDELDDLLDTYVVSEADKVELYNTFNDTPIDNLQGDNDLKYDDWLDDMRSSHFNVLMRYLKEKDNDTDYLISKMNETKVLSKVSCPETLIENKKLAEGGGAGYTIKGTLGDIKVNSFNIKDEQEDKYGIKTYEISCDIDATFNDIKCESYYYSDEVPQANIKITGITLDDNMIVSDDTPTELNKETIKYSLEDITIEDVIGGGFVHQTFDGEMNCDVDGSVYQEFYLSHIIFKFVDEEIIDFIDQAVQGDNYISQYDVFDSTGDLIDTLDDEESAIQFAKDNNGVRVMKNTYKVSFSGDYVDTEEDEMVWEKSTLESKEYSKQVKKEGYKRRINEENNKSANLISDMFTSSDFDSESKQGQIVMRTSNLFNALSDKGYDVQVAFDNGESTSAILLGEQGGQVVITINNTNQPLRAFTTGNFEINKENLDILTDIEKEINNI